MAASLPAITSARATPIFVVTRTVTLRTEPRDRAPDQARMLREEPIRVESEALERAPFEVVDHDVGARGQVAYPGEIVAVCEICRHRELVPVD